MGRDRHPAQRVVAAVVVGLLAAAVAKELRTPQGQRSWHGTVVGIPYDLRPPTVERFQSAWWNPDDPRIVTPRDFGVGWALNLGRLLRGARRG